VAAAPVEVQLDQWRFSARTPWSAQARMISDGSKVGLMQSAYTLMALSGVASVVVADSVPAGGDVVEVDALSSVVVEAEAAGGSPVNVGRPGSRRHSRSGGPRWWRPLRSKPNSSVP
jgi:hypothetical protein